MLRGLVLFVSAPLLLAAAPQNHSANLTCRDPKAPQDESLPRAFGLVFAGGSSSYLPMTAAGPRALPPAWMSSRDWDTVKPRLSEFPQGAFSAIEIQRTLPFRSVYHFVCDRCAGPAYLAHEAGFRFTWTKPYNDIPAAAELPVEALTIVALADDRRRDLEGFARAVHTAQPHLRRLRLKVERQGELCVVATFADAAGQPMAALVAQDDVRAKLAFEKRDKDSQRGIAACRLRARAIALGLQQLTLRDIDRAIHEPPNSFHFRFPTSWDPVWRRLRPRLMQPGSRPEELCRQLGGVPGTTRTNANRL